MASTMFNKYVWLVNTIYETGRISKEEIDRRWASCYLNDNHETHIQKRAFHRYKKTWRMPKDFHADEYFAGYYGVIRDEKVHPEIIRIKATLGTANYLRSLPLHTSQKEVEQTAEYSVFEYFIVPTLDFIQELRSQGESVEVLYPTDLRDQMKQSLENGLKNYEKEEK